ncbi:MAG: hypothetical protein Q8930_05830 [Bacillota bacterium]|nr:hypothetical protein [Bacillota bacterium]
MTCINWVIISATQGLGLTLTEKFLAESFYRFITGRIPMSRSDWYINYKGQPMDA